MAVLALCACAAIAHADALTVTPLATPAALATAREKGLTPRGAPMSAAERAIVTARLQRQREFEPLQQQLFSPGKRIDRSLFGNRRVGWVPPLGSRRDPAHAQRLSGTGSEVAPPDTIHLAFLRIDFLNDRGGAKSSGTGRFNLDPADTVDDPVDRPPHNRDYYRSHAEALRRYYEAQSYGRVVVDIDVWPAERDSAYHVTDMADLGPWSFGQGVFEAAVKMMRLMFFAADSQSTRKGDRIPWDHYDRFCLIHAGSDLQSDIKQDSKEDIPSFTLFISDTDRVIFPDSTTRPIDRAAFIPETINQDGYYGAINGVLAHENGHNMFGFLDVYNVESGFPVVGYWSLMDSGNLVGSRVQLKDGSEIFATGLLPPSIDPLQRDFIGGGLRFVEPAWGETLSIANNERNPLMYKVPLSSDEYLLLENRYQSPAAAVQLDADSITHVVLGPKTPDRYEYDALLPGSGILVWHIDASVIPFDTSLRPNADFSLNSNPARHADDVIQASGLDDLGDTSSPYLLGSPLDPYQRSINPSLSDSTQPSLIPNQKTRPHTRIDFLDDTGLTQRFVANRTWALPNWPIIASFPPGGPQPLAIDMDGDRNLEVCWAGGRAGRADSSAIFAVRASGQGLFGSSKEIVRLDRRPRPVMAAVLTGDPDLGSGPSLLAVTTYHYTASDTSGGRVWLIDRFGAPYFGWPVRLPSPASTPPVIAGVWPNIVVFVGAENGRVYALDHNGAILATSDVALTHAISGRLAFWQGGPSPDVAGTDGTSFLAAGSSGGEVAVFAYTAGSLAVVGGAGSAWPKLVGPASGFDPDFLWLRMNGTGAAAAADCAASAPVLVAHHADRLWAFCPQGAALPGWGRALGDTIVAGLGAGDADGDGFPEVLYQTVQSKVGYLNRDGYPSPGWPKPSTTEHLRTASPALALDVDHDGRSEVVVLDGSGVIAALDSRGKNPPGWPLATGAGASGSGLAADLDRNGTMELVAPDRDSLLYAYSLPVPANDPVATSWTMLGGDPGRTCALLTSRTSAPSAASAGPLVRASFKAFPNPARRKPVQFAFTLSEPAQVEFRIVDTSGHEVASFSRHGERAENLVVWDPGSLPAGLYVARVKFSGAGGSQVAVQPVGLLR